ncbi:MAG: NAD-dependent epimerase/dehydratase family protein [Bacteroidales bacterium]|nr:NAD-dependent epimerase/dehydratase family protein [Bacteroidales bacterium]
MKRILLSGSNGQIGSELIEELRKIYGRSNVIGADLREPTPEILENGPYVKLDITNAHELANVIKEYKIDAIINMAAILSAVGEQNPHRAWNVNINGLINILEVSRELGVKRILNPSSIAVFGPTTPKENTPQETVLKPTSMYGITKVTGELLGEYYVRKYNLDVRGLRYPGIISYKTLPGGGTTDYAVAIFFDAIKYKHYKCFLKKDTMLPMMYMPDCLKATIDLFHADFSKLKHFTDFNIAAMSFTPEMLYNEIKKYLPEFTIEYEPDYRQQIADSWPRSIDDSLAREEWGWAPSYDMETMVEDMIKNVKIKVEKCEY